MGTLLIALGAFVGYLVAYHTYGAWLARKIFRLDPEATVPSVELRDDRDYVPTPRAIVFGHHFTSIAGTGPIVGPAIAVMWGWLPALLWVLLGSIFIGAVHDFGALVVSLRNRGQTVGDIAGRVLNPRVRLLFLFTLFMALTIVIAIFGLVIAAVFRQYPAAIFPCVVQIPIAVVIGLRLHRRGVSLLVPSLLALGLMYATVVFGDWGPLHAFNGALAGWSNFTWVVVLLAYSYVASVLPVWTLLQPRDYINSLQLLTALGLIVAGLVVAAFVGGAPAAVGGARPDLVIAAPLARFSPEAAPLILPFLFITIACGAISGFHCLVSSGTSSKQLACESDARFVGYGSMLTEGLPAPLVILPCVAGLGLGVTGGDGAVLTGADAFASRYASWTAAGGLGAKVGAFVDGSANFLRSMGIPAAVATALMGVLVASFAGTTLDTACRLQRYVIQELAGTFSPRAATRRRHPARWLTNRHGATIVAVILAAIVAALPPGDVPVGFLASLRDGGLGGAWGWLAAHGGKGGLILWPMFGATNQLLGGLAFLVIGFWLWRRRLPVWFLVVPMIFMLVMPAWAMIWQLFVADAGDKPGWIHQENPNWVLIVVAFATLLLEAWMVTEAVLLWPKVRGVMERSDQATKRPSEKGEERSAGPAGLSR
jgi:carbon starvation protein